MDQGRVCMSYARALLEWNSESGIADEVYAQSACLVRLIDENPRLLICYTPQCYPLTKKQIQLQKFWLIAPLT